MSYQYIKGAISSSLPGNAELTGSFVKLQAIGAYNAESVLERIEFGQLIHPESDFVPTGIVDTDVKIPNGDYIDGPIARFKVKSGGFLAYYSN